MNFSQKAHWARIATLVSMLLLAGLYWFGHFQEGKDVVLRSVVSCLPILVFMPGILASKHRSGSFLCFVLLIYFMFASQSLFIPGALWHDVAIMTMIIILFSTAMMYSRWQQRANVFEGEKADG